MSGAVRRRALLQAGAAGAAAAGLAGCERLSQSPTVREGLESAEPLTKASQRALQGRSALAREYRPEDVIQPMRANGSTNPAAPEYRRLLESGFQDWRLQVHGLVRNSLSLSLDQLRAAPSRTQITRHDCVEGWSCIAKWTGVQLSRVLAEAGLLPNARYVVFHCADALDQQPNGERYYESIDLVDAFHPQTILAYEMNDAPLPVANGAPLRVRVERQLGYKMAKYLMRIEAVESFAHIGRGNGGYWEDRGYEWYAGI